MAVGETFRRFSQSAFVEAFLLRQAEEAVRALPKERIPTSVAYFQAAERRVSAVGELFDSHVAVALPLYRDAALLYMAAALALRSDVNRPESITGANVVSLFRSIEHLPPSPQPPRELDEFFGLVANPDPMEFDRLPADEALDRIRSVRAIVTWLRDLSRPRTLQEVKAQRRWRIGSVAFVVAALFSWALVALFSPKNIALRKPVSASSQWPGSPAPGGFTDGVTTGSYGFATNYEPNPSVVVDLLDVFQIDKIKIYNRGDCCAEDAKPWMLDLSENGVDYAEVDKRTTNFGQWQAWTYSAGRKKARYIRVRSSSGAPLALSEIEAFGRKLR